VFEFHRKKFLGKKEKQGRQGHTLWELYLVGKKCKVFFLMCFFLDFLGKIIEFQKMS